MGCGQPVETTSWSSRCASGIYVTTTSAAECDARALAERCAVKMCYCLQQHAAESEISVTLHTLLLPTLASNFILARKQLIIQLSLILTSPPLPDLLNVGLAVESLSGGQRGTNTVRPTGTRRWYKRLCSLKVSSLSPTASNCSIFRIYLHWGCRCSSVGKT